MYRTLCTGRCVHAIQEGERGNHGVCLNTSRAVHSGVRRMHDLKRSGNSFCLQRNTTAVGNRVHNAITVVLSSSLVPNLRSHGT